MNPVLWLVLLVGGLKAAGEQGRAPGVGPDALVRAPGPPDAAVAAGVVGLTALLALTGVVIACCVLGLAAVLLL